MVAAPHPCPSTSGDSNKRKRAGIEEEVQGSPSEEDSKRMRDSTAAHQPPSMGMQLLNNGSGEEGNGAQESGSTNSPHSCHMEQYASLDANTNGAGHAARTATDGWDFTGLPDTQQDAEQAEGSGCDDNTDLWIEIKIHLEGSPKAIVEVVPYSTNISALLRLGTLRHGIAPEHWDNYDMYDLDEPHAQLPLNRAHSPIKTLQEIQLLDGHQVKLRPSQPHLLFEQTQPRQLPAVLEPVGDAPATPDSSGKQSMSHTTGDMHGRHDGGVSPGLVSPTSRRMHMSITRGSNEAAYKLHMASSAKVLTVLQRACHYYSLDRRDWRLVDVTMGTKRPLDESKTLAEQLQDEDVMLLLRPRQRPALKTLHFKVMCDQSDDVKDVSMHSSATIGALKRAACMAWDITAPKEFAMFDYFNQSLGDAFHQGKMHLTLADAQLQDNQHLLLKPVEPGDFADGDTELEVMDGTHMGSLFEDEEENKDANGDALIMVNSVNFTPAGRTLHHGVVNTYGQAGGISTRSGRQYGARQGSGFGGSSFFRPNVHEDSASPASGRLPGLAGLSNLGNTCFMNSSLQCLAHAVPLLRAFLTGNYLTDLNRANPLGMKGELAEGFGQLMHLLWQGGVSHVVPRKFKERIGRFAPQFSGYAQHDSQEFLAFLVDGLHEDLNRIKNKPYIEEKDSNGRPDAELAAEAWANYRARNDSTIVDHFQGLYKSRLDCPKCKYTSVKFDPFMYLTLPLPESRMRAVSVTTVLLGTSQPPVKCVVEVANTGNVKDIHMAVWQLLGSQCTAAMSTHGASMHKPDIMDITADGIAADKDDGTAGSDHEAEAVVAGPQPPMLTAKVMRHTWLSEEIVDILTLNARVTDIVPNPRSFNTELLVVYIYPYAQLSPSTSPTLPMCMGSTQEAGATAAAVAGAGDMEVGPAEGLVEELLPQQPSAVELASVENGQGQTGAAQITAAGLPASASVGALSTGTDTSELPPLVPPTPADVELSEQQPLQWPHAPFGLPFQPDSVPIVIHHRNPHKGYKGSFFMVPLIIWAPAHLLLDDTIDTQPQDAAVDAASDATPLGRGGLLATQAIHAALKAYRTATGIAADSNSLHEASQSQAEQPAHGSVPEMPAAQAEAGMQPMLPLASGPQQHTAAQPADTDTSSSGPPLYRPEQAVSDAAHLAGSHVIEVSSQVLTDPTSADDPSSLAHTSAQVVNNAPGVKLVEMGQGLDWPATQAEGNNAATGSASGAPSSTPFAGPSIQPFNMWSAQQEPQMQQVVQVSEPGEVTGPGFRLCLADEKAQPQLYSIPSPFNDTTANKIWHVLADWDADGGARWDMAMLDAEPLEHPSIAAHAAHHHTKPPVTLQACVDAFLQPEVLSEDDSWYCPRCKEHVQADKKLDLWALPEVLVVHLKRFSYTRYSRDKLDTPVKFPLVLDMDPYICGHEIYPPDITAHTTTHSQQAGDASAAAKGSVASSTMHIATNGSAVDVVMDQPTDQPSACSHAAADIQAKGAAEPATGQQAAARPACSTPNGGFCGDPHDHKYELFGVVNHFGSLGGGHYTAHAKVPGINQWYTFDDSSVHHINPTDVVSPAAYLLFWRRVSAVAADPPDLLPHLLAQHQERLAAAQQQEEHEQREREQQSAWGAEDDAKPAHDQTRTMSGDAQTPPRIGQRGTTYATNELMDNDAVAPLVEHVPAGGPAEQQYFIPASHSDVQLYNVRHQGGLSRGGSGGSGVHRGDAWRRSLSADADHQLYSMQCNVSVNMAATALNSMKHGQVQQDSEGQDAGYGHLRDAHQPDNYGIASHTASHHEDDEACMGAGKAGLVGFSFRNHGRNHTINAWDGMNAFPIRSGADQHDGDYQHSGPASSGGWSQDNERGSLDGHPSEVDLDEALALHMSVGHLDEDNLDVCSEQQAPQPMFEYGDTTAALLGGAHVKLWELHRAGGGAAQQEVAPDAASDSASAGLQQGHQAEPADGWNAVARPVHAGTSHTEDVPATGTSDSGVVALQAVAVSPAKCVPSSNRAAGQYAISTVNNNSSYSNNGAASDGADGYADQPVGMHGMGLLMQNPSSAAPSTTWHSSSGVATDATGTLSSQAGGRGTSGGGSTGATADMMKMALGGDDGNGPWSTVISNVF